MSTSASQSSTSIPPVLDGTQPFDRPALTSLARERSQLAANWLANCIQPDGRYAYFTYPETNTISQDRYNEVRHAGGTFSLYQAYGILADQHLVDAADRALDYIIANTVSVPVGGAAFFANGRTKLGAQALALVAFLERRRVTGKTDLDDIITDMATFLTGMEIRDEHSRFYQSYDVTSAQRLRTPNSDYYPGEALLALSRLAVAFPDRDYLDVAKRLARYLIFRKDGNLVQADRMPRDDHWLTIALSELHAQEPDPDYALIAFRQTDAMTESQIRPGSAEPWTIGGSYRPGAINYTSTATKAEAMNAAWELARSTGIAEAEQLVSDAALRTVQFALRTQYTDENTSEFPNPEIAIGAWAQDIDNTRIRMDFVQHNLSAIVDAIALAEGKPRRPELTKTVAPPPSRTAPTRKPSADTQPDFTISTKSVIDAAQARNIPVQHIESRPDIIELGNGAYRKRYNNLKTSNTSGIAVRIARNKALTNEALREAGLPVPGGSPARTVDEAIAVATNIGYPVVVKPNSSNNTRGVTVNIQSEDDLRGSFEEAQRNARRDQIVVEQYIHGREYRILVIDDKITAVYERVPASVVGDGEQTIRQLIAETNEQRREEHTGTSKFNPIPADERVNSTLAKQGLALDDIPDAGQSVQLYPTGRIHAGGTSIDRTDNIHPTNSALAIQAAQAVGLDIAGLDVVTPDIAESMVDTGGAIVEVNSAPGFSTHLRPIEGQARDIGAAVVDMLFPPGTPVRAPLIAVLESDHSSEITDLVASILSHAGQSVGVARAVGMRIGDMKMTGIDATIPNGPRTLLDNPDVETAIVEIGASGASEEGLGFSECEVVVASQRPDPESSSAEATIGLLSEEGTVVLDTSVPAADAVDDAAAIGAIMTSTDHRNKTLKKHIENGGTAIAFRRRGSGGSIVLFNGDEATTIVQNSHLPTHLRDDNLATAVSGIAGAFASGISIDDIQSAVRSLGSQ